MICLTLNLQDTMCSTYQHIYTNLMLIVSLQLTSHLVVYNCPDMLKLGF